MCLALQHLHSHGVAHLDVKPDNIYTVGSADNGDQLLVKLGDFGQATRFKGSAPKVVDEGDSRCGWAGVVLHSAGRSIWWAGERVSSTGRLWPPDTALRTGAPPHALHLQLSSSSFDAGCC